MTDIIKVSVENHIANLSLNRPEKSNALNAEITIALLEALQTLAKDKKVGVLIIQGIGKNFCAGADIAWMAEIGQASHEENYQDAQHFADLMYEVYSFSKPTIALAHGATFGGGLGFISACDIALASRNTQFSFSEVKLGLTPATISPYVISAIGERKARYYFLTGERFNAEQAKQMGLIHEIVEDSELSTAGLTLAAKILENGPKALIATKQLLRYVAKEKLTENLVQKTAEELSNLRITHEAQEGLRAFLEKRKPNW